MRKNKIKKENQSDFHIKLLIFVFILSILIETVLILGLAAAIKCEITESDERIIYMTDKIEYENGEMIKFYLINDSNKSIFLRPCDYFNYFEKKNGSSWDGKLLECNAEEIGGDFSKVYGEAKESLNSSELGAGVFRGVSFVYFDCSFPDISKCSSRKTVYSNEFRIK